VLLEEVDLDKLNDELRSELKTSVSETKRKKYVSD